MFHQHRPILIMSGCAHKCDRAHANPSVFVFINVVRKTNDFFKKKLSIENILFFAVAWVKAKQFQLVKYNYEFTFIDTNICMFQFYTVTSLFALSSSSFLACLLIIYVSNGFSLLLMIWKWSFSLFDPILYKRVNYEFRTIAKDILTAFFVQSKQNNRNTNTCI